MAVGKSTKAKFFSISKGKIVNQVENMTATSKERISKTGKVVHEEFNDYIDGRISFITTKENEYGKFWLVTLRDDLTGEDQILQFNYVSGYSRAFLKILPNVNLDQNVTLIPTYKEVDDVAISGMFINQNGKSLKWFYTKENQNGLPPMVKIKVKGKDVWDDSEGMEFLENMVRGEILPKLMMPSPKASNEATGYVPVGEENEPAPF